MCGISFYYSREKSLTQELSSSLSMIDHRGPDANGKMEFDTDSGFLGFGHVRLSIIDLSESGAQPMQSSKGNLISYNGEVYNFLEQKESLEDLGEAFKGSSDTEVVLKLYENFGVESFSKLKGMFAFALYDKSKGKVYLVRDVLGIKPLYIYQDENHIIASSEIKGLKPFDCVNFDICREGLYEFFSNGFLYEPRTGYRSIQKLMPGHFLELDIHTGESIVKRYSSVEQYRTDLGFEECLDEAVKQQLVADVPLGVFFSGGTDSSILASMCKKQDLFFARYASSAESDVDKEYSEKIAQYLEKQLVIADLDDDGSSTDDIMQSVDFVAKHTEELVSDYTFWATYQLSKVAREKNYKVMLSGMGGDEAFAGYPRYLILKYDFIVRMMSPLLSLAGKFRLFPSRLEKKFDRLISYSKEKYWPTAYSRLLGYFGRSELEEMFSDSARLEERFVSNIGDSLSNEDVTKQDKVKLGQKLDQTGFLAHNLTVSDKASMLASIELRVPLLSESVVALGLDFSSAELIGGNQPKKPLTDLLKKLLPTSLVERPKTGFNPPLDGLIMKLGRDFLEAQFARLDPYINTTVVTKILDEHYSGKVNNTYKLWQLLYFSRWLKFNT